MSYLRMHNNPFIETTHLSQGNIAMTDSSLMPRTYQAIPNDLTSAQNRKRKHQVEIMNTPERSTASNDSLITPPRSCKRVKTAPSSPLSEHNHIYETPQTPTSKHDYTIPQKLSRSPNYRYSVTSPDQYATSTASLSSSSNDSINTPQESHPNPPKLNLPRIRLANKNHGGNMYNFADTSYPYILNGSILTKENGSKLSTWRQTCDERVRHGFVNEMKVFNKYSEELSKSGDELKKSAPLKVPSLSDNSLFPAFKQTNDFVNNLIQYPTVGSTRNFSDNIEEQAKTLMAFKSVPFERKATIPLKSSQVTLPPFSEILRPSAIDKSTIHASGLTTQEYKQFHNPLYVSIDFQRNSGFFHNGRQIRTGQDYKFVYPIRGYRTTLTRQRITPNYSNSPYQARSHNCIQRHSVQQPLYQQPIQQQPLQPLQQPTQTYGTNAYADLNQEIQDIPSEEEVDSNIAQKMNAKQLQGKFKTQPLKINKTRRASSSVSKTSKFSSKSSSKEKTRPAISTSNISSRVSSRRSSRKSSFGSYSEQSSGSIIQQKQRTRSSSRKTSNESIMTAEVSASIENTPNTSPMFVNRNQECFESKMLMSTAPPRTTNLNQYHYQNNQMPVQLSPSQIPTQYTLPPLTYNHINTVSSNTTQQPIFEKQASLNIVQPKIPTIGSNPSHKMSKTCMSCKSTSSPCWRPSWSPDEGQLCNSCGLRYRKTKARCYNSHCLKIPSKSEWNLMTKRGKVPLEVYDDNNQPCGEVFSYKCLECDSAMQLLQ